MKRINLIDRVERLAELQADLEATARAFAAAPSSQFPNTSIPESLRRLHVAAVKLGVFAQRYIGGRT